MRIRRLSTRHRSLLVTSLDLLTILALATAAILVYMGGTRFWLGDLRVSLRNPQRGLAWAVGIAAVRWILWRDVPFLPAFRAGIGASRQRLWQTVSAVVAATRRAWFVQAFRESDFRKRTEAERISFANSTNASEPSKYYMCGLVILCLLPLWPQLTDIRGVPDPGDPFFSAWRLAWVAHQIISSPIQLFDANIFYPMPLTFTYSDAALLPGLVAAPLIWAGVDPLIASNLLFVTAFPLAGVAFFVAARRLTGDPRASFIAGLMGGLLPFHFEHYSHLELQFFFWIPLAVIAAMRLLTAPRILTGVILGAVLAGQCLTSMYFGAMLLTYLIPFVSVVALGWRIRLGWPLLRSAAAALLIVAAVVSVLALPYLRTQETRGEWPLEYVQLYSATPTDYLEANYRSAIYRTILHSDPKPERQLFPGATPLLFGLLALSARMPVPAIAAVVSGAFAVDWSLGVNGLTYEKLLYRWLMPYRNMRVPARFAVFAGTSLILLSAYGVWRLLRMTSSRDRKTALFLTIVPLVMIDLWPSISLRSYWPSMPTVYKAVSSDMVLAEFPMRVDVNIPYQYFSTSHWARLLNGYSGHLPQHYNWLEGQMRTFPSRETLNILRQEGATHITVNCAFYWPPSACRETLEVLDRGSDVRMIARGSWEGAEVRLYRLSASGPSRGPTF